MARGYIISAAVLLVFPVSLAASGKEHPEGNLESATGSYGGSLWASGYDMPVETSFSFQGGVFTGEYLMDENGTLTPGVFTDFRITGELTVECTWTDVYGSGPASFTFNDDFTAFTGWWAVDGEGERYYWQGARELTDIQLPLRE